MAKAINDAVANLVKKAPASSQPDSSTADSKADSSSKAASNASNTNPSTGVAGGAFALALLSGTAVVMAKKKK
ncbi:NPXTG-anchored protein [uncultured Ruminococcus sp.]|uniref:NPXTG-anchored protein n=1 Tax=uncultured Ruminococcus sp. TaxID=165186 RepID=UPI002671B869|nr:NPXTG-anchored protein [uncultured Ruminococcus sp.]